MYGVTQEVADRTQIAVEELAISPSLSLATLLSVATQRANLAATDQASMLMQEEAKSRFPTMVRSDTRIWLNNVSKGLGTSLAALSGLILDEVARASRELE